MNINEGLKEALEKEGISVWLDRGKDFSDGFRAGVEWAEEYGDCSMVKFFADYMMKKEEGDDLSAQ